MSEKKNAIHIVALSGSIRPDNLTNKILNITLDEIKKHSDIHLTFIDPVEIKLIFPGEKENPTIKKMQKIVSEATGIILATPEYHGSYSSVMKVLIENLGYPSILSGKPIVLLGIASGQIGAIKALEHLSSVCAHLGGIVLPCSVSVAGVHKLFDKQGHCRDKAVEKRIRNLAVNLINYIRKHIAPCLDLEELEREGKI